MTAKSNGRSQLNEKQKSAIELLVQGLPDGEVGTKIGVCRETVCRWRNEDSHFIAELNQRRSELWEANRERIKGLIFKALNVLEDRLDHGDARIALEFLKRMDADLPPLGGTDADAVVRDLERERRFKDLGFGDDGPES